MRFTSLRLQNFKPFENISVSFDTGVSVIHGPNGAGKSSFIEGAFFALYGSDGLSSEETLDDIVTNETSMCVAEVEFVVGETTYTVKRNIVVDSNGNASTDSCLIEWEDGLVEGVRNTKEKVESLINMSAESYLNCAYVRQGETTRLINASPEERKSMIDDLFNLGILEVYKERGSNARVGVKRARRTINGEIDTLENSISDRDIEHLKSRVEEISNEITTLKSRNVVLKAFVEQLQSTKSGIVDQIESDVVEEETKLKRQLKENREKIAEKDSRRMEILTSIHSLAVDQYDFIQQYNNSSSDLYTPLDSDLDNIGVVINEFISSIDESEVEVEQLREEVDELESKYESVEQRVSENKSVINTRTTKIKSCNSTISEIDEQTTELQDKISSVNDDIENIGGEIPDDIDSGIEIEEFGEEIESLFDTLNNTHESQTVVSNRVGKLSVLKEVFEDTDGDVDIEFVDESITSLDQLVNALSEVQNKLSHLEGKYDTVSNDISERISSLVSLAKYKQNQTRISELESKKDEYIDQIHTLAVKRRVELENIDTHISVIQSHARNIMSDEQFLESISAEISTLENDISDVESQIETNTEAKQLLENIEQLQSNIVQKAEQLNDISGIVNDRRARVRSIESELDDIETPEMSHEELIGRRDELEQKIHAAKGDIEEFNDEIQSYHAEHGEVTQSMREHTRESNRLAELREKKKLLDSVYSEAQELETLYGSLRSDLRESNVEQLEILMNEIFNNIYQTRAYQRINISNEYEIDIIEKSGSKMKPHMLSGGEKVVFNMSLRSAIYKLIAESGSGDDAIDSLPPLILDEPTAHLDDSHISQLTEVVDMTRDMGVSQTLIISHQEEIVDNADAEFIVTSDSTTNRSSIERDTGVDIQL